MFIYDNHTDIMALLEQWLRYSSLDPSFKYFIHNNICFHDKLTGNEEMEFAALAGKASDFNIIFIKLSGQTFVD